MKLGSSLRRRRGRGPDYREVLRKVGLLLLVLVAGFGGGYLLSTELLFPAPEPPDELVEVPDLRGLDREEAERAVRDAGFALGDVDSLRHPRLPAGAVVGQSPVGGQEAIPGDSLRLTVSLGPERRPVPDVSRLGGVRALAVLEATGFDVEVDSVESSEPRGSVVEVDPEPGTDLALPGEVRLTLSLGPPQVEMPLLLGLREEEALVRLDSLGLSVAEVATRFRFGLDQGVVIDQEPEPGILLERGSAVRIVVGRRGGASGNIPSSEPVGVRGIMARTPPDVRSR